MRFLDGASAATAWMLHAWITTTPPAAVSSPNPAFMTTTIPAIATATASSSSINSNNNALSQGVSQWIAASSPAAAVVTEPSADDVQLLRQAFSEFYSNNRNLEKSEELLSRAIQIWNDKQQPGDEIAGLYRVRGDCYMALANAKLAYADYDQAVKLLSQPSVLQQADPAELPASLLGRARSIKASLNSINPDSSSNISPLQVQQAARDYERALKLSSREEWDDEQDLLEDGASRNPYACWEWGSVLRRTNDWNMASTAHFLAAAAFDDIGDKPRAAISYTDAGIDLAAVVAKGTGSDEIWQQATTTLQQAIKKTIGVQSKDVDLLNRVISKEGEGRMALAALLWTSNAENRAEAERVLGETCARLEQQMAQKIDKSMKIKSTTAPETSSLPQLRFSIDDDAPSMDVSCFRFKNPVFLNQLGWPDELQQKVIKLETLR